MCQNGLAAAAAQSLHEGLRSPAHPLEAATREFMEPRFGHDFGAVRIHADAKAAESAKAVNALAYTVGRDVVFSAGRYSPATADGRRLLGHELTHVVQQTSGGAPPDERSEAAAEAAARKLDKGGSVRVGAGTGLGVARQPSPTLGDDDLYQSSLEMPQIEKDRLFAAGPFSLGAPEPEPEPTTARAEDIGCHTDPYKKSPGQPKCATSHHKTTDDATRVVTELMQKPPRDFRAYEKDQRDQLDRLNAAFLYYRKTGKYIHRDEFSPLEIEKDNIIATSDRWDAWMSSREIGINNLEAAKFDEHYFRSKAEFDREWSRRDREHDEKFAACKSEHGGPKWPELHRTRPDQYGCEEAVDAEYGPMQAAAQDARRRWAHHDMEVAMPILEEGNPIAGGTFHVTHEWLNWSTDRAAAAANIAGGLTTLAGGWLEAKGAPGVGGGGGRAPFDPLEQDRHVSDPPGKPVKAERRPPPVSAHATETQPDRPPAVERQDTAPSAARQKAAPAVPPRSPTVSEPVVWDMHGNSIAPGQAAASGAAGGPDRVFVVPSKTGGAGQVHVVRGGREETFSETNRTLAEQQKRGFLAEKAGGNLLSLEEMKGKKVLDLAAGTQGQTVQELRKLQIDASGMDIALSEQARQAGPLRRADLATTVPFKGGFDIVYELYGGLCYGLGEQTGPALRNAVSQLRPGGTLYLVPLSKNAQASLLPFVKEIENRGGKLTRTPYYGEDEVWRLVMPSAQR